MRQFRRFNLLRKIRIALFLVVAVACVGVCAGAIAAQSAAVPTKPWNVAAARLADKVAAIVSPAHPVNFEVVNISGLSASDADAVRAAVEAQVALHHFRITRAAADTRVRVTLSESSERYVWTAEIRQKNPADADPEVAIVSVARSDFPARSSGGPTITLKTQLVWTQATKFLDFRVVAANVPADARLIVLEPSQVVVYRANGSSWEAQARVPVKQIKPWPRDVRGYLKTSDGAAVAYAMPGIFCAQGSETLPAMKCQAAPDDPMPRAAMVPGVDVGDAVDIGLTCGDARAVVASGVGDWTQADSLQGYLVAQNRASTSGAAVQTSGPVMALIADSQTAGTARAVVHNLKAGNYEGYVVTASCSE